jgi:hypothetical protein
VIFLGSQAIYSRVPAHQLSRDEYKTLIYFSALKAGFVSRESITVGTMTGGLVQEFQHTILPSIPAVVTLVLTVLSILVRLAAELALCFENV